VIYVFVFGQSVAMSLRKPLVLSSSYACSFLVVFYLLIQIAQPEEKKEEKVDIVTLWEVSDSVICFCLTLFFFVGCGCAQPSTRSAVSAGKRVVTYYFVIVCWLCQILLDYLFTQHLAVIMQLFVVVVVKNKIYKVFVPSGYTRCEKLCIRCSLIDLFAFAFYSDSLQTLLLSEVSWPEDLRRMGLFVLHKDNKVPQTLLENPQTFRVVDDVIGRVLYACAIKSRVVFGTTKPMPTTISAAKKNS
jgi:hypothetical protein